MSEVRLDMEKALSIVGVPPEDWGGKCHQVSSALAPYMNGKVRRGYYLGPPPEPGTYWAKIGLGQHSWIELEDGQVCDPTRFSFRGGEPELWVGPADEYDIGGCIQQGPSDSPPEIMDTDGELTELNAECVGYLVDLLGADPLDFNEDEGWIMISIEQAHWLAHLPILKKEGSGVLSRFFAAEVYEALCDAGFEALIPIDRLAWILPERVPQYQPEGVKA